MFVHVSWCWSRGIDSPGGGGCSPSDRWRPLVLAVELCAELGKISFSGLVKQMIVSRRAHWRAVVGWYARLCRGAVGGATVGRVAFIPPLGMVVALTVGGALRSPEEDVWNWSSESWG